MRGVPSIDGRCLPDAPAHVPISVVEPAHAVSEPDGTTCPERMGLPEVRCGHGSLDAVLCEMHGRNL